MVRINAYQPPLPAGCHSDLVLPSDNPSGARIVEAQEAARSLHFVLAGKVELVGQSDGGARVSRRQLGPGRFFGELELAKRQRHMSTVVAVKGTTCLVLSEPDPAMPASGGARFVPAQLVCSDASAWIDQKMLALAAHRTQVPIRPEMFPRSLLLECSVVNISCPPIDRPGRGLTPTQKAAPPQCAPVRRWLGWRREPGHGAERRRCTLSLPPQPMLPYA